VSVNAERLVADFLRAHPETSSLRFVAETPDKDHRGEGWVQIQVIDGPQQDAADHLVDWLIQFDCYAGKDGGVPEAIAMGAAVRKALQDIQGKHDRGVASRAMVMDGPRGLDTDFEPARERKILTASIPMHP
jgi:hypothetical protein